MPELPDLNLYAKNLRKQVLNKEIYAADIFNQSKVNVTGAAFKSALVGSEITAIDRNGKELFFTLSSGHVFGVHLMLFGRFTLLDTDQVFSINQKIISIGFESGESLVVSDFRGMCRITMDPPPVKVPDAMSDAFDFDYLKRMVKLKAMMNIKALLIDQKIVRGIGNAYVDEILYVADVSPKSVAGKIPEDALHAIYNAIHSVFENAAVQLDRLTPDAISGEERSFFLVHNSKKRETEKGEPILVEDIAQKRTYYTKSQKLYI